jgi:hypothetical protein
MASTESSVAQTNTTLEKDKTTTDAPNNTTLPGEVSGVIPDAKEEKKTTDAPNNTTLPGEVSGVIPDAEEQKTTTDAPNNTTLAGEVSGIVPDAAKKETTPATVSRTLIIVSRTFVDQKNRRRKPRLFRNSGHWLNQVAILRSGELPWPIQTVTFHHRLSCRSTSTPTMEISPRPKINSPRRWSGEQR